MRNTTWLQSRFKKAIRITLEDYEWILQNKGKKSAAGFLQQILAEYKKPNLFKKGTKP
jgi:predicted CopG family antitoxin